MMLKNAINGKYSAEDYFSEGNGILTLCGSTRFYFEAVEADRRLTFQNWAVLKCGSWGHSLHKYAMQENHDYEVVKKLHYHKILLSNCIVVVTDENFYIGESTQAEIAFAKFRNLPMFIFDGKDFVGATDVKPPNVFTNDFILENFKREYGTLGF